MSELIDPPVNTPTPWEFFPDDDIREEPELPAELAAMHIERVNAAADAPTDDPDVIVHYFEDERPEVLDRSVNSESVDATTDVEDLLIRQHYLPPAEP